MKLFSHRSASVRVINVRRPRLITPPLPTNITDLKTLQASLIQTVGNLSDAIGDATDEKTFDALSTELTEVTHRATIVGGLIFDQDSQALFNALKAVNDATADVNIAIQQAQSAIAVINSVTGYLKLVDNVIAVAKQVAAA